MQNDFARLGLDRYATLVPGWFNETLPTMPERGLKRIAILRVDSDIYSSIMETLQALYPKLSAGGYVVFDDYKFRSHGRRCTTSAGATASRAACDGATPLQSRRCTSARVCTMSFCTGRRHLGRGATVLAQGEAVLACFRVRFLDASRGRCSPDSAGPCVVQLTPIQDL